jgi:long-chain acyl-CoA synthetase
VAIVGRPNEEVGEIVTAIVVPEGGRKFDRREFDAFVRQKLSAQQRPKIVEIRTGDLPRNFLGKVLRRELRESPLTPLAVAPEAAPG